VMPPSRLHVRCWSSSRPTTSRRTSNASSPASAARPPTRTSWWPTTTPRTAPASRPTRWPTPTRRSTSCTGSARRASAPPTWPGSPGAWTAATTCWWRWTPTAPTSPSSCRGCSMRWRARTSCWVPAGSPAAAWSTGRSRASSCPAAGTCGPGSPWACRSRTSPAATGRFGAKPCSGWVWTTSPRRATASRSTWRGGRSKPGSRWSRSPSPSSNGSTGTPR
jgi:hypothetical protein